MEDETGTSLIGRSRGTRGVKQKCRLEESEAACGRAILARIRFLFPLYTLLLGASAVWKHTGFIYGLQQLRWAPA